MKINRNDADMVKVYQCQLFCLLIVFKFWSMPVYLIIKMKTELMIDCVSICVCESVASQDSVYRNITASVHIDHSLRFMLLLLSFTRSFLRPSTFARRFLHSSWSSQSRIYPKFMKLPQKKMIESLKIVTSCCCSVSRQNK